MARRKAKRPSLFKTKDAPKSVMKRIGDTLVQKTLDAGTEAIRKMQPENTTVTRKPTYLKVTEKRLNKLGVIDLKPYFAQSSHKKTKKKGAGWYMVIPIPRKKKNMSRRMYEQLRSVSTSPSNERTVISDYLYDRRRTSDATLLNYEPVSYNINKKRTGKRKHTYISYRTVSNKSPASSWIINRSKVNEQDTSKTFVQNVDRLMKWKMKNGWD
jgi:hypothetical protein